VIISKEVITYFGSNYNIELFDVTRCNQCN